MSSREQRPDGQELGRLWHVGAAVAVAVAVVGYFTATRDPPRASRVQAEPGARTAERMPAYSEMGERRRGPNADMYTTAFETLTLGKPSLLEPVVQTEQDKQTALLARASRRAYDGAPPTIPHEVRQRDFPDCLACHDKGAKVASKWAPRMSHARYDNCTQCHVPSVAPQPLPPGAPIENTFVGLTAPASGSRAWAGAPPTIPHPTLMRSECSSCHGTGGLSGMRSTHPARQSCTQCHVSSAVLDQRAEAEPVPVWERKGESAPPWARGG